MTISELRAWRASVTGPGAIATSGLRLKQWRNERGMSQADLAYASGVHRRTIVRFELGDHQPSSRVLARLAVAGVDTNVILTGKTAEECRGLVGVMG